MENAPPKRRALNWKPWAGLLALAGAVLVFFLLRPAYPRLALFWVFGLLFGYVLQRSRFCFVSAVSNFAFLRDSRLIDGILGGLAVMTIGFAFIMHAEVPDPAAGAIPSTAFVAPFGWHLVLAGVLFGVGMLLAGGCILSNLYRLGEGAVASLVAFIGILAGFAVLQHNYPWWWSHYISARPQVWLPAYLGWPGAVAVTLAGLGIAFLIVRRFRARGVPLAGQGARPFSLRALLVQAWPLALGGLLLAVLNVLLYWRMQRPWGISGEVMRWAQLVQGAVHLPAPPTTAVPGT